MVVWAPGTDSAPGLGGWTSAEASITWTCWLSGNSPTHSSDRAVNCITKWMLWPTGMIWYVGLILNSNNSQIYHVSLLEKLLLSWTWAGGKRLFLQKHLKTELLNKTKNTASWFYKMANHPDSWNIYSEDQIWLQSPLLFLSFGIG